MIQRIQTIFLLLAAIAIFLLLVFPFTSTAMAVPDSIFSDRVFDIKDQAGMLALFSLAGITAIVSIFLFKNRKIQMRLTLLSFIITVAGIVWSFVFYSQALKELNDQPYKDELGRFLPLLALVFTMLAYRFIRKDEKLVKSMDRLR